MRCKIIFGFLMCLVFAMVVSQSHALTITAGLCPENVFCWEGVYPTNPNASDVSTITGIDDLVLLYKNDVDDGEEDGAPYDQFYSTEYLDTPDDPSGAIITSDSLGENLDEIISCPECYLLVKDGVAHTPIWYLYDLGSVWNGIEDIVLEDFWPGQGAISHVAIFGTPVPEPTTMIIFGVCFATLAGFRLRKKK